MKISFPFIFYALYLMIETGSASAQTVIEPTKADPTYYIRKLQTTQKLKKSVKTDKVIKNVQPNLAQRTDDINCFIPRDTSYIAIPRNDDGSFGPVTLPFSYSLYGTPYTQVYINTNGNLTFTSAYSTYNASGFPSTIPMVAGFWADVDTENPLGGQIYYKVSPTRLIVTWDGVGYYNDKVDKLNTFQIILTNGLDSIVGLGNNTAFYYKDMQWTTGDHSSSGGINGFSGNPATVGINKGNGTNYVQIGRFNQNSSLYDGPGNNNDGVNYLDNQCFNFNVTNTSNNIPPSVSGLPTANPVTINVGDTVKLTPQFIGPEVGQTVTTVVNTRGACRVTHIDTNGLVSKINLTFIADTCNVGTNVITFTATDNGSPVQSTVINYTIIVNKLNQAITFPAIGDRRFGIPPFTLGATVSSGLPVIYTVIAGPATITGNILTITGVGIVTIRASQPGNTVFNAAMSIDRSFCILPSMPSVIAGDTLNCVNTQKTYSVSNVAGATFSWTLSGGGTITSSGNTATVQWTSPGTHIISVKYNGNCGTSDSTRTLSVRIDTELTGTFTNLLPANGTTNIMLPISFSWSAINNALSYDLFIWPASSVRPVTPTVANLTQSSHIISDTTLLQYEVPYRWQVVAKRNCYTLLSPIQNFTLRYSPDLIVDSIGVPVTGFAGRIIKVAWKVKNTGRRITTASTWTDKVFISANPVFNPGSALVQYDFIHTGNLLPDGFYIQQQEILLPQNITGTYYIHVFTDAVQQLTEYNPGGEDNNTQISNAFNVDLKMPADLLVSQIISPVKASAGQKANFKWTIKNQGDTALNIPLWNDKIYISPSATFNINNAVFVASYPHSGGLAGNSDYNNSVLATVPTVAAGNYYLYVVADGDNNAAEFDETNNIRRSDNIIQIGIPDLMANNVSIPSSVGAGQTLKVRWRITNVGSGATETASWTDRIFLSPLANYTPNNAIWFDVRFAAQTLNAGASLDREIDLTIPDIISGRYYAYVYTDFNKTVYEDTSESNNISRSPSFSDVTTGLPVNDIGVSELITPKSDCGLTANETVKIRITNYGNLFHTGFNVGYRINNGTPVTENIGAATLLPGSTLEYTFITKANLSAIGGYAIKTYTTLTNDSTSSNDTIIAPIQHFSALSAPGNLLPQNGSVNVSKPINFSWSAVPNATKYDLYVWKTSGAVPTIPVAANLNQINYYYSGNELLYGASYNWKVVAKSNNCSTTSAVQTFTMRNLPDLIVDEITAPSSGGTSEANFSVSWKVRNVGLGTTGTANWNDRIYISESPTDRSNDVYLTTFQNFSALDSGQSYTHPLYTFSIPQGYQGTYYIVIRTDFSNSVEEVTDTNNLRIIPITITLAPPPDLQVDSLVVSPTTLFSEDTINVSWTVKNLGTGPTTTAVWADNVYLSTNDTLNVANAVRLGIFNRNGALTVGGQYTRTERFRLPAHIGGTYFIHVLTDANNVVYEYTNNFNNTATFDSIQIIMRPNPNLTITSASIALDTASNNQTVPLQWTTKNEGAVPALPVWWDNLRLTNDTANGYSTYQNLGTYSQNNILQSLSANGSQKSIQLPNSLAEGKYYVYGVADIYNSIFEGAFETDNISPYSSPLYIVNPDLKPIVLQAPATAQSEENITLSYSVRNMGKGGIYNATWSDAIYLSSDTVLDNNDVRLSSISNNILLLANNEYTKQQTVTLPVGISGTYHLLVVTDEGSSVFEKNESNNRIHTAISITIAPWPDLEVTSIQHPPLDTAGTNITFSYSVQNTGHAKINSKSWSDAFYLSPTKTLNDPNKVFLTRVTNNARSLDTMQSYSATVTAQLPSGNIGQYYLLGITDDYNTIFEHTDEGNNRKISDTTVLIAQLPNVDLAAISGQVTADSLTPGQTVAVIYNGQNVGTTPTIITQWEDAIYLSNNSTLDATDQLLKTIPVNRVLQPGATYTQTTNVTIPNDASGTLYFLVNIDKGNQQTDINRGNNTRVLRIVLRDSGQVVDSGGGVVIVPPLPADLVPVSFSPDAMGTSGQPFNLSFIVQNTGTGPTNNTAWTDRAFLSTDYVLDGSDIAIGSFPHTGRLTTMAQYADTQQVFVPGNVSGNYVVIFKTDVNDNVYERNAENNNLAFGNIFIQPQQPGDLIVATVTPPPGIQIAGQNATINYRLKNIGSRPAQGYFRDAVYLSADSVWDANDVLFGTSDLNYNVIQPLDSITRQLTRKLTNVTAGNYFVMVRTDILNNLVEDNENNNTQSSLLPMIVDVKLLTMNVPATDTLINNEFLYYKINISASQKGETMSLTIQGDSVRRAVNRLYLRFAQAPAANVYDFVAEIPFQANQEIIVPALKEGSYYIMASGNDTATNLQPVTLLARIIPFAITKVDAKKGGNTGAVTIKINGAKFDSTTSFKLNTDGSTIMPVRVYYTNSTQVFATFNLLGANVGLYNVVATKMNNDSTRLVNGFEVETGVGSTAGNNGNGPGAGTGFVCQVVNVGFEDHLETGYEYPPSTRPSRLVGITIFYANRGNVDIPAPTRFFTALKNNVPLSLTPEGIALSLGGLGSALGNILANLALDFIEPGSPPGILRPGASGYKKIYSIAYQSDIGSLDFVISK